MKPKLLTCYLSIFAIQALILCVHSADVVHHHDDSAEGMSALLPSSDWNSTMFWGTYRPNVYFGMRTRSPTSFLSGIMWHGVDKRRDGKDFESIRHTCEEGDHLGGYGWKRHNGIDFGEQDINDDSNDLFMKTTVIKNPTNHFGGEWTARISGKSVSGKETTVSLFFYFGSDLSGDDHLDIMGKGHKGVGEIQLEGSTKDLGSFSIVVKEGSENVETPYSSKDKTIRSSKDYSKTLYYGINKPADQDDLWQVKEPVLQSIRKDYQKLVNDYITNLRKEQEKKNKKGNSQEDNHPRFMPTLPNTIDAESNLYVFQKIVQTPFEFDIVFSPNEETHKKSSKKKKIELPESALYGAAFEEQASHRRELFDQKFENVFKLKEKGFDQQQVEFAQATFSNLLGGVGYFYGNYLVKRRDSPNVVLGPSSPLFSAVPSRPFFPRGFLWDEGFHQLLIQKWNPQISMDVLRHWFNLMDSNGWIPREQILGSEARTKVPREFQVQYEQFANPPTLLLVLDRMNSELSSTPLSTDNLLTSETENKKQFIADMFPKVEKWFNWFLKTQSGFLPDTFRWRGRTENHTLTSGLDDYPRHNPPSEKELHVDLLCWMIKAARLLSNIASAAGKDGSQYLKKADDMLAKLEELHWNEAGKLYTDHVLAHSTPSGEKKEAKHITHVGYISLFPLLLGLVPKNSPHLGDILSNLEDPKQLWSDYGIRSISISDPYFGTGENYWKGPIWININYLILSSLHNHYVNVPGSDTENPHKEQATRIYNKLRDNLINNIYQNYQKTGYVWEQYNPIDGHGQRSHPFTGWTSLVVLIMAEKY